MTSSTGGPGSARENVEAALDVEAHLVIADAMRLEDIRAHVLLVGKTASCLDHLTENRVGEVGVGAVRPRIKEEFGVLVGDLAELGVAIEGSVLEGHMHHEVAPHGIRDA